MVGVLIMLFDVGAEVLSFPPFTCNNVVHGYMRQSRDVPVLLYLFI